jgi:Fe-S-cluster-containing hydrogenase component 2
MKQIVVYQERCTSCRECEMACSFEHGGVFNPSISRIRVQDLYEDQYYLPMMCVHCADAPCATVCPTVAITRESSGQVQVDDDRCIGCKMCLLACPFGVMGFSPQTGVAHNCDLCGGDPKCVEFCVPQALAYEEVETSQLAKQKFAAAIARDAGAVRAE